MSFSSHQKTIIKHYQETTLFYRIFWSWNQAALHAGFYDRSHLLPHQALANTNKVLASLAGISSADTVLDAGCGTGGSAVFLAKSLGAKVIGINLSPLQLSLAKRLAQSQGVTKRVSFLETDYCQTPFLDSSFDVVWALDSVCHAENKQSFVNEAFRLLKNGGRLVVSDGFLTHPRDSPHPLLLKLLLSFEKGYKVGELVSLKEFWFFLEKAGFRKVEFFDKTSSTRPNWWLGFFLCLPSYPFLYLLDKLKVPGCSELKGLALTGIMQPFGELFLGVGRYGVFLAKK